MDTNGRGSGWAISQRCVARSSTTSGGEDHDHSSGRHDEQATSLRDRTSCKTASGTRGCYVSCSRRVGTCRSSSTRRGFSNGVRRRSGSFSSGAGHTTRSRVQSSVFVTETSNVSISRTTRGSAWWRSCNSETRSSRSQSGNSSSCGASRRHTKCSKRWTSGSFFTVPSFGTDYSSSTCWTRVGVLVYSGSGRNRRHSVGSHSGDQRHGSHGREHSSKGDESSHLSTGRCTQTDSSSLSSWAWCNSWSNNCTD